MDAVSTSALTRHYGRRRGVEDVELSVAEGSLFGFLGPNGSGKSTTIRMLLGFLRPSSGSARIFGRDCWSEGPTARRHVGYVPGDLRLPPWLTARTAIKLVGQVRGEDVTSHGVALTERFALDPDVPVRKMSRGMRQKVGLIMAIAPQPRLLVLDEPTSGLDPLMQDELAAILREQSAAGRTVFFSSHSLAEVEMLCDRIAIVREGRIVADADLDDLRRRATRQVVVVFASVEAAAELGPPDGVRVLRRSASRWEATLDGAADGLVQWAATQRVVDLEVGPPTLEGLFRQHYHGDAE